MLEDRRRPAQYAAERDDELRRWIADEVYPYAPVIRKRLDAAGLGRAVRSAHDLRRLPAIDLDTVGDAGDLVLEPARETIREYGSRELKVRLAFSTVAGRNDHLAGDVIDPLFRPVVWTTDGPRWIGWSSIDLDRLAAIGRRALGLSGVDAGDRILLAGTTGTVADLQIELGCRDAGVAFHRLAPASTMIGSPTVVAGPASAVVDLVGRSPLPDLVTIVVLDGPADPGAAARLAATGAAVRTWWAPPGVRAAWADCHGASGFHTWPEAEVLDAEVSSDGEPEPSTSVVWSAVGWRGTVLLRVRTGIEGSIHPEPCPDCGRTTPRVRILTAPTVRASKDGASTPAPPAGPQAPGRLRPERRRRRLSAATATSGVGAGNGDQPRRTSAGPSGTPAAGAIAGNGDRRAGRGGRDGSPAGAEAAAGGGEGQPRRTPRRRPPGDRPAARGAGRLRAPARSAPSETAPPPGPRTRRKGPLATRSGPGQPGHDGSGEPDQPSGDPRRSARAGRLRARDQTPPAAGPSPGPRRRRLHATDRPPEPGP